MSRRRRREPSLLDLLPPLFALLVLGVFTVPGFLAYVVALVVLLALAAVAFLGVRAWLRARQPGGTGVYFSPQVSRASSEQVPAYRSSAQEPGPVTPALPELTAAVLKAIEWKRFEQVVAAYVRELGQTARTTRVGPDGGVDVEVLEPSTGAVVMVVQCKAWNAYKVGIKPVRELYGVMAAKKLTEAAFFTTGVFTQEAREFGATQGMDLVDGAEFLSRVRQLSGEAQRRLAEVATEGDYAVPTCPSCDTKMTRRTASRGRSAGDDFYGCMNYPRCRRTFPLPDAA